MASELCRNKLNTGGVKLLSGSRCNWGQNDEIGRAVSTQTMHQTCAYKRSHGTADLRERQHGSGRKRIRRSGVVWLLYRPAVWCDAVHCCIHSPTFRRDLFPSPALKIGATCSFNSRYIFTRLHGLTPHNNVRI